MKILKVTLENIKSYQKEEIVFNDGINVIAGRNGAGKSTLIEAIGFALFGYLNNSLQDFLSYGATNGSILIDFEVDGLRYRIERHFNARTTKNWVIYDYQTDETIETHTNDDVSYTIAKLIGNAEDITLSELFERIIGVNQGTFTEPFLRSTGGRKEYFERIFMLDSYKTAYQKSSESATILRTQLDDLEKELIKLRTRVESYKDTKRLFKEEEDRLTELRKHLAHKQSELARVKEEIYQLKAIKELILRLENEKTRLDEQNKQLTERISAQAEEIKISIKAKELVEQYQKTREDYLHCKAKIEDIEKQLEFQEQQVVEKQNLEKKIAVVERELPTREENMLTARTNLNNELVRKLEEIEEYSIPLQGVERELKLVAEELLKVEKNSADLSDVVQSHQESHNMTVQFRDRMAEIESMGEEIAHLEERLAEVPDLREALKEIGLVEQSLAELNHTISAVQTRIESAEENIEQVGDGLCPLLKTECKTLEGQNLKEYFALQVEEFIKERAQVLITKEELARKLTSLREKEQRLAVLNALEGELTQRQQKFSGLQKRGLELSDKIYANFQKIYEKLNLIKKCGYLTGSGALVFKETLPLELALQYSFINTQLDILTNWMTIAQNEIKSKEKECLHKKDELSNRKTEFVSKINQLKDRCAEINRQLVEIADQEQAIVTEKDKLKDDLRKVVEISALLAELGDLKGELKTFKVELSELEEGNNIYLTNQQKALELNNLLEDQKNLQNQLEKIKQRVQEIDLELLKEKESFEPKVLEEKEVILDELNRQVTQSETLLSAGEERLADLKKRLEEMESTKVLIKEKEETEVRLKRGFGLLNFIRNVYNTSAQEIAHVFLHFISHEATKIYRQLSGENVQLIWEKDYQVSLKDKHRTRVFRQLSGGEQMSAAFAIRLALLRKFSTVRLGFFDEPTTHLDEYRRLNIAQAIAAIREKDDNYFEQIFIISHDDTFTTLTENLIKLDKDAEQGSFLVKD